MAAGDLQIPAAIGVGGGIGSIARYELAQIDPAAADRLPFATLLINLTGSLLLGLLVGALAAAASNAQRRGRQGPSPLLRPFLGTGVLGGFTTFSAFAVQTLDLSLPLAAAYLAVSVVGGVALAAAGLHIGSIAAGGGPPGPGPVDPDLP